MGQPWEEVQTVLSPRLYPPSLEECSPHLKNLFPALNFRFFPAKCLEDDAALPQTWGLLPPHPPSVGACPCRMWAQEFPLADEKTEASFSAGLREFNGKQLC